MIDKKLGLMIFASLVVVTGVIASSRFESVDALLSAFKGEQSQEAPAGLISTTGPVEIDKPATEEPQAAAADETAAPDEAATAKPDDMAAQSAQSTEPATEVANLETPDNPAVANDAQSIEQLVPSFDLLRVEPNGSVVIAGRTKPLAKVEIVTGSTVLAKTTANDRGEFVAVFDEALKQGDYEMVLRSSMPDGTVMTSAETAIVSIPKDDSGQVLALVRAPGVPSRLITKTDEPAEMAQATSDALTTVAPASDASTPDSAPAPDASMADGKTDMPQAATNTDMATPTNETMSDAPSTALDRAASAANDAGSAAVEAAKMETANNTALKVSIEAVEIDGTTLFIAGKAEAGSIIRLYANDKLLGDTQTSPGGTYLMELNRDLPVGDYVIRADQLTANRAEVVARAAVPFRRTEGEKLAAVAAPSSPAQTSDAAPAATQENAPEAEASAAPENQEMASSAQGTTDQPLQAVSGSVVIRRGDTLWEISKRIYGQGIKYTTIYQANQQQIKDPDMIWPGQVFDLPKGAENQ